MATISFEVPTGSKSSEIHDQLDHPVIDSDGHILEFEPAVFDFLRGLLGKDGVERFRSEAYARGNVNFGSYHRNYLAQFVGPEERLDDRMPRPPFWAGPTRRTMDRAATMLPALLNECLEQIGIDYTVLYPSFGLLVSGLDIAEFRQAGCRAANQYNAEVAKGFEERMTTVATIPMHTPQEAIAELEYAVNELGFKAVMLQSYVVRPVPKMVREHPDLAGYSYWIDNFCVDSLYDYDPVWAKCNELGVSPTFHTPGYGWGTRAAVTNWVHNHVGAFACAGEATCRALIFGGVPARFPDLRFGFCEGGVGYAVSLYADVIGHWKKRNRDAILDCDPANLDMDLFRHLFGAYGGPMVQQHLDRVGKQEMNFKVFTMEKGGMESLDEFAQTGVERAEDFKEIFESFYFGCEADDPVNASAFNSNANPHGARLNAMLSSDIGHFDVPDITEVLEEAYELVEDNLIDERDFRDFTFVNAAHFWTSANPDFFTGTAVEAEVAALLAAGDDEHR